jgi:hypothetical protein
MKRLLVLALIVVLVSVATTRAAVKEGDNELSLSGSWTALNNSDKGGGGSTDSTLAQVAFGHFFTNELEISIAGLGMWQSGSSDYGIGLNAKYHFMTESTVVPYVGAQGLYDYQKGGGDSQDGIMWGPLAGIKFFVSETTSVFVEYQYLLFGGDVGKYLDDGHRVIGGIAFKF